MNRTVVMKFGGTSVGTTERLDAVAKRVVKHRRDTGENVIVVVSAMSGETDRLVQLCRAVSGDGYDEREYSQLVASGEQVSSALMALALQREGEKSISLTAHQVQMQTKEVFGKSLISSVDSERLSELLKCGVIPVIAGFQGINAANDLTTLGRGGSDTTAVAVAATMGAQKCVIFTDVDGVYSASPKVCKGAKKLSHITYEEMLELASSGAKVLQTRSVDLARKYKVVLSVQSSFNENAGTEIVEEYTHMEDAVVSGINCLTDEAKLTLRDLPDNAGNAARIFRSIAEAGVVVDMIVQSQGAAGVSDLSFTVSEEDSALAYDVMSKFVENEMPGASVELDTSIAKLSIVGEGMRTHAGVAAQMFEVLGEEGINLSMITTSEIKISVAIDQKYSELAVRALHEFFVESVTSQKA